MTADLTCSICGGSGERVYGPAKWCVLCNGTGRRPPKLAEWDALEAERNEWKCKAEAWHDEAWQRMNEVQSLRSAARDVLLFRDRLPDWVHIGIAAALGSEPDLAERTRRIKADE